MSKLIKPVEKLKSSKPRMPKLKRKRLTRSLKVKWSSCLMLFNRIPLPLSTTVPD